MKSKGILLFLGMMLSTMAMSYECTKADLKEMRGITGEQYVVLMDAFVKGQGHDLSYTMMAIVWEESKAGKYLVNVQTNDYGVAGINLNTASKRNEKRGAFQRNLLAQRLIFDTNFNLNNALQELIYWKDYHSKYSSNPWRRMVASYNAGFAWRHGAAYMDKVGHNVHMFTNCMGV